MVQPHEHHHALVVEVRASGPVTPCTLSPPAPAAAAVPNLKPNLFFSCSSIQHPRLLCPSPRPTIRAGVSCRPGAGLMHYLLSMEGHTIGCCMEHRIQQVLDGGAVSRGGPKTVYGNTTPPLLRHILSLAELLLVFLGRCLTHRTWCLVFPG